MKILRFLAPVLMLTGSLCMQAETPDTNTSPKENPGFLHLRQFANTCNTHGVLNKLDLGVTVGTTGIGLELGTPLTKWAHLRVGASFIPHVNLPLHFGLMAYTEGTSISTGNFDKIKDMMYEISGYEMDDVVNVDAVPKMWNLKCLVDIYPIPDNHHWRVTGGVRNNVSYHLRPLLEGLACTGNCLICSCDNHLRTELLKCYKSRCVALD